MNNEALIAVCGVLTALIAAIRWLMQVNYKQSVQLQTQKREQTQKAIDELKLVTEDLKKEIRSIQAELKEASNGFKNNQAGFKSLNESLKSYVESNEEKIANIVSEVLQLSKELKLVRGLKNGKRNQ